MSLDDEPLRVESVMIAAVMVALAAACFGLAFRSFYDGRQADGFLLLVVGVACLTGMTAELGADPLDGFRFGR